MRAWLLYTKDNGETVDQTGYGDRLGVRYGYDTDVPNHKRVAAGDVIVLRNAHGSLGAAFVHGVRFRAIDVETRRCPECNTKQLASGSRCSNGHDFEVPLVSTEPMQEFSADYEGSFVATTQLPLGELESLCVARARQNAMRELDLDRTLAMLRRHGVRAAFTLPT